MMCVVHTAVHVEGRHVLKSTVPKRATRKGRQVYLWLFCNLCIILQSSFSFKKDKERKREKKKKGKW